MSSVFYIGLLDLCKKINKRDEYSPLPPISLYKNGRDIVFKRGYSHDKNLLCISYHYADLSDLDNCIVIEGGFIIEKKSGFVIQEYKRNCYFNISISFHEMMSSFFEFEIPSLYQKILKKFAFSIALV